MKVTVRCDHCSGKLRTPGEFLGRTIACPLCGGKVRLPETDPNTDDDLGLAPEKDIQLASEEAAPGVDEDELTMAANEEFGFAHDDELDGPRATSTDGNYYAQDQSAAAAPSEFKVPDEDDVPALAKPLEDLARNVDSFDDLEDTAFPLETIENPAHRMLDDGAIPDVDTMAGQVVASAATPTPLPTEPSSTADESTTAGPPPILTERPREWSDEKDGAKPPVTDGTDIATADDEVTGGAETSPWSLDDRANAALVALLLGGILFQIPLWINSCLLGFLFSAAWFMTAIVALVVGPVRLIRIASAESGIYVLLGLAFPPFLLYYAATRWRRSRGALTMAALGALNYVAVSLLVTIAAASMQIPVVPEQVLRASPMASNMFSVMVSAPSGQPMAPTPPTERGGAPQSSGPRVVFRDQIVERPVVVFEPPPVARHGSRLADIQWTYTPDPVPAPTPPAGHVVVPISFDVTEGLQWRASGPEFRRAAVLHRRGSWVSVHDLETGRMTQRFAVPNPAGDDLEICDVRRDEFMLLRSSAGSMEVWDLGSGRLRYMTSNCPTGAGAVAWFSGASAFVAFDPEGQRLVLHDWGRGNNRYALDDLARVTAVRSDAPLALFPSPSRKHFALLGRETVRLMETASGKCVGVFSLPAPTTGVEIGPDDVAGAFSPDGTRLAVQVGDAMHCYDLVAGQYLFSHTSPGAVERQRPYWYDAGRYFITRQGAVIDTDRRATVWLLAAGTDADGDLGPGDLDDPRYRNLRWYACRTAVDFSSTHRTDVCFLAFHDPIGPGRLAQYESFLAEGRSTFDAGATVQMVFDATSLDDDPIPGGAIAAVRDIAGQYAREHRFTVTEETAPYRMAFSVSARNVGRKTVRVREADGSNASRVVADWEIAVACRLSGRDDWPLFENRQTVTSKGLPPVDLEKPRDHPSNQPYATRAEQLARQLIADATMQCLPNLPIVDTSAYSGRTDYLPPAPDAATLAASIASAPDLSELFPAESPLAVQITRWRDHIATDGHVVGGHKHYRQQLVFIASDGHPGRRSMLCGWLPKQQHAAIGVRWGIGVVPTTPTRELQAIRSKERLQELAGGDMAAELGKDLQSLQYEGVFGHPRLFGNRFLGVTDPEKNSAKSKVAIIGHGTPDQLRLAALKTGINTLALFIVDRDAATMRLRFMDVPSGDIIWETEPFDWVELSQQVARSRDDDAQDEVLMTPGQRQTLIEQRAKVRAHCGLQEFPELEEDVIRARLEAIERIVPALKEGRHDTALLELLLEVRTYAEQEVIIREEATRIYSQIATAAVAAALGAQPLPVTAPRFPKSFVDMAPGMGAPLAPPPAGPALPWAPQAPHGDAAGSAARASLLWQWIADAPLY